MCNLFKNTSIFEIGKRALESHMLDSWGGGVMRTWVTDIDEEMFGFFTVMQFFCTFLNAGAASLVQLETQR